MFSVRCPTIFIATERGTPARSRFLTAVRRSCRVPDYAGAPHRMTLMLADLATSVDTDPA